MTFHRQLACAEVDALEVGHRVVGELLAENMPDIGPSSIVRMRGREARSRRLAEVAA